MKTLALLALVSLFAAPSASTRSTATVKRGKDSRDRLDRPRLDARIDPLRQGVGGDHRPGPDELQREALVVGDGARGRRRRVGLPRTIAEQRAAAARVVVARRRPVRARARQDPRCGKAPSRLDRAPRVQHRHRQAAQGGRTTRPGGGRGGSTTVTGLPGGGFKVVHRTSRGGVEDTTTVTMNADGSSVVERVARRWAGRRSCRAVQSHRLRRQRQRDRRLDRGRDRQWAQLDEQHRRPRQRWGREQRRERRGWSVDAATAVQGRYAAGAAERRRRWWQRRRRHIHGRQRGRQRAAARAELQPADDDLPTAPSPPPAFGSRRSSSRRWSTGTGWAPP